MAWDERFVALLDELARQDDVRANVHVKLDTGMGRLGAKTVDDARAVALAVEDTERLELSGAMTHFATADEPGDDHFGDQLERFAPFANELRKGREDLVVHAANSAATYRDKDAHFDMVRCGIAVYGLDPFHGRPDERGLAPALRLESYVAAVRRFEPGESAGYGRRWVAEQPTWVGTLPSATGTAGAAA